MKENNHSPRSSCKGEGIPIGRLGADGSNPSEDTFEKELEKEIEKTRNELEDAEDLMRESKTYGEILEHRRQCSKWGKEFCLECFGGGLTLFTKNLMKERHNKKAKEDISNKLNKLLKSHHGKFIPKFEIEDFVKKELENEL